MLTDRFPRARSRSIDMYTESLRQECAALRELSEDIAKFLRLGGFDTD